MTRLPIFCGLLVAACFIAAPYSVAGTETPEQLLGTTFPDPGPPVETKEKVAGSDEAGLALLSELPHPSEVEALLAARDIHLSLRGKKDVRINNKVAPATVLIQGSGTCTGTIVSPEGKVLTCWHCVRGKDEVFLRLHPAISQGESPALLRARVERMAPEKDLAMLQIISPPKGLPTLPLGDENDVEVGADVYAVGHPSGLHWTFVKGYISQFYRQFSWSPDKQSHHSASVIQSQIPLYEGNSGGPLISEGGKLIGVNAARREGEEFTFAVAVGDVRRFVGETPKNPLSENLTAKAASPSACRPARIAERRNADNTATMTFFDSKCSGKADMVRFVFDDGRPDLMARTSELGGRIDMVAINRKAGQEVYIRGKNSTIELEGEPTNANSKIDKLQVKRP